MILQVHDELVFDALLSELDVLKPVIEKAMKNALPLDVPLVVEMNTGKQLARSALKFLHFSIFEHRNHIQLVRLQTISNILLVTVCLQVFQMVTILQLICNITGF